MGRRCSSRSAPARACRTRPAGRRRRTRRAWRRRCRARDRGAPARRGRGPRRRTGARSRRLGTRAGSRAAAGCCAARARAAGRRRRRGPSLIRAFCPAREQCGAPRVYERVMNRLARPRQNNVLPRRHTMILRIDRLQTRAAAPVRSRPGRRRRRAGAAGRQVRRDVDLHELHLPVVQLPQPPGRAAVLRPRREHRGRGVRPHRARLGGDQHDAHRRGGGRARHRRRARLGQGHPQHPAVHRRRRRHAGPGLQRQAVERRLRLLLR